DGLGGGKRDMSVDVADSHGDARRKAGPLGGLGGQRASTLAQLADAVVKLVRGEAPESRVDRRLEVLARVLAVLIDALVSRGAGVADVLAAQLPHDPVSGLDPVVHPLVDLRVLLEELERLGVLPLRVDEAAVALDPRLAARVRELV